MKNDKLNGKLRIAILQRVSPPYRVPLFNALTNDTKIDAVLFIGENIPDSKVNNAKDLTSIRHVKLTTSFLRFGSRVMPWHHGLLRKLRSFNPDIILCEGESHILGYLVAIYYKYIFKKSTKLIHWCFISLPGENANSYKRIFRNTVKSIFRNFFDAHLVYSSFSRDRLLEKNISPQKIFVNVNVGDTSKYLDYADKLECSDSQARNELNLPNRFTILYVGTIDSAKKPDLMIDLAMKYREDECNIVLLGNGPLLEPLVERANAAGLKNVFFVGRQDEKVGLFSRASNVVVIPGRGGIVISESMALGLPVVIHEADGTEFDLVIDGKSGIKVSHPTVDCFFDAVEKIRFNPESGIKMGKFGQEMIRSRYNTSISAQTIIKMAQELCNIQIK